MLSISKSGLILVKIPLYCDNTPLRSENHRTTIILRLSRNIVNQTAEEKEIVFL